MPQPWPLKASLPRTAHTLCTLAMLLIIENQALDACIPRGAWGTVIGRIESDPWQHLSGTSGDTYSVPGKADCGAAAAQIPSRAWGEQLSFGSPIPHQLPC